MECVQRLSACVLQVGTIDRWVWNPHVSQSYTIKPAYSYSTAMNTNINEEFDSFLWLKAVPLKVNILMCRLFLNRLPTKDNVFRRGAIADTQLFFVALCGEFEDHNHVFFQCDVYGRLWLLVSNWLALVSAFHGNICHHAHQFCGLGGSSKKIQECVHHYLDLSYIYYMERSQKKDFPQQVRSA